MKRFIVPAVLVGLWLLAWANGTGVLVWSETATPIDREYRYCHYLVGFTVDNYNAGESWRVRRCPLFKRI